jgi:tetratricopeptide (TPR) repeat protein
VTASLDVDLDREGLEAERKFLLRSIEDLEAERTAGELDDERYRELLDRYTARAAAVLRSLDAGVPAGPATPSARGRRRLLAVLGVIAVAAVAAALLASSLGLRQPGGTLTGNDQSGGDVAAAFARNVELDPDDVDARLAYARCLLQSERPVDAVREFDTAARLDPSNAEAHAYGGWILFLAGLTDEAISRLDAAVAADPDYPDAHFFRGMALLRGRDDRTGAAGELRTYLDLRPRVRCGNASKRCWPRSRPARGKRPARADAGCRRHPHALQGGRWVSPRHRDRCGTARSDWRRLTLQHLGDHLVEGGGPDGPDELGHHHTALVDDVGLGDAEDAEVERSPPVGIHRLGEGEVELVPERPGRVLGVVVDDPHHADALGRPPLVERPQVGRLLSTGDAPRRPEVDDVEATGEVPAGHLLALQAGEVERRCGLPSNGERTTLGSRPSRCPATMAHPTMRARPTDTTVQRMGLRRRRPVVAPTPCASCRWAASVTPASSTTTNCTTSRPPGGTRRSRMAATRPANQEVG